jgi:HJR/Mrr/RecB family endonuclease
MIKLVPEKSNLLFLFNNFVTDRNRKINRKNYKEPNDTLINVILITILIFIIWAIIKIGFKLFIIILLVLVASVYYIALIWVKTIYTNKIYKNFLKFYDFISNNPKLLITLDGIQKLNDFEDMNNNIRLINEFGASIDNKNYQQFIFTFLYYKRTNKFLASMKQSISVTKKDIIIDCYNIFGENSSSYYDLLILFIKKFYSWEISELEIQKTISNYKKEQKFQRLKESVNNPEIEKYKNFDNLSGYEFESFISTLYKSMGYNVTQTPLSGDQGADLIVERNSEITVVQAKRFQGKVGNKAVQEVVASVKYYGADYGAVITNNYFTKSAYELAFSNRVKLIDRVKLIQLVEEFL